jgi:hypothetical protein
MTMTLINKGIHIPADGAIYKHYKGGTYTVLGVGRMSEARDQIYVFYHSHERDTKWMRPLGMWLEELEWPDGVRRQRFSFVEVTDD